MPIDTKNTPVKNHDTSDTTIDEVLNDIDVMKTRIKIDEFAKAHYDLMYKLIRGKYSNNHEDSEEIVQNTLLKAHKNAKSFTEKGYGVKPWIFRIMYNEFINFKRYCKKHNAESLDVFLEKEQMPKVLVYNPYELNNSKISVEDIRNGLNKLKEEYPVRALLLEQYSFEDKSYGDLAKEHNILQGTVKSKLYRARQQLKELLKYSPSTYEQ